MIDVLSSLVDVNQRFRRLALDSLYIRDLDMTCMTPINSLYDQTSSINTQVLSKIYKNILPQIHHQVYKLTVEEYSMKQILRAANYPQLYSLSLFNFQEVTLHQYLRDDLILRDLLTEQITHLNVVIKTTTEERSEIAPSIFAFILSLCKKLIAVNIHHMFPIRPALFPLFGLLRKSSMPSTLIKLKINVATLFDCLYLLDGLLVCLSTLIVHVNQIFHPFGNIDPTKKLPKLKHFSLTTCRHTFEYDTLIVPLLCRMINLEELKLYLSVGRFDSTYIDGIQLYEQFLIYMTQLKKFTFNIKTQVENRNVTIELPSNEDIQCTFIGRNYPEVVSYINTNPCECDGECHIYTLPYDFDYFLNLNNSFQGGMFHKVRQLTMKDMIAFEHELFQLISQDFPFLEYLRIYNDYPQKDKQHSSSTLITFSYLTLLDLESAYVDYAELFLLEKNMHLPRLVTLTMQYKSLTTVTHNFTADATHFNFNKLKSLRASRKFVRPENFHQYFPFVTLLEIV
ncbi:unnamed protein product [Rotaria sp. Silwood2]|nr:unnamed protein product [Rotaria sp. Silwood2]